MEKVFSIVNKNDDFDFEYWQSKSELERLNAVQVLRERIYFLNPELAIHGKRLQRVYTIIKR